MDLVFLANTYSYFQQAISSTTLLHTMKSLVCCNDSMIFIDLNERKLFIGISNGSRDKIIGQNFVKIMEVGATRRHIFEVRICDGQNRLVCDFVLFSFA